MTCMCGATDCLSCGPAQGYYDKDEPVDAHFELVVIGPAGVGYSPSDTGKLLRLGHPGQITFDTEEKAHEFFAQHKDNWGRVYYYVEEVTE